MANRSMQAKRLKMVKQRRAWARPLSIRSGISPNFEVIKGYKNRAEGLKLSDADVDALYFKIFKRHAQQPKRAVMKLLLEMNTETPEFLFFNILDSPHERVDCYFNSQKTCYYLVHEHFRKNVVRRSCTFASKEAAVKKWHMSNVVWVEYLPINPAPSD